ncbi:MAG TPA: DUF4175 family protein [Acidobacteriota bacterium]|nr:DUF4175 family protein [Acidobacteriota bacterium]
MAQVRSTAELVDRLRSILRRQRLVFFGAGLLATIAAGLAAGIILSLLANLMVLPVWLKISLVVLAALTALYVFARFALALLFRGDIERVAVRLEERHPEFKGRLIAAVQFARARPYRAYSSQLVALTEQQALERAAAIDFGEVVSFHAVLRAGRVFFGSVLVAVALLVLFPGLFTYSYEVYSNVTTEVAPPLAYEVVPIPGSTEWVKYRDINIGAAVVGRRLPERAYIYHRLAGGNWQKTRVDLGAIPPLATERGDSVQFGILLRQISRSFDYYVEAGRLRTEVQSVDVVDRPRVTGITLTIFYPDYTGLAPLTIDENNGSFSAVVGSRVTMKLTTNLSVETAALVFEDSSRTPLALDGKTGTVALQVDRSRSYSVELVDRLGEYNPDPIEYYVTAVPDEFPTVDVVRPGFDANLSEEMILPFKVRIFDDYGFSSLVLKYTVVTRGRSSEEHVAVIHFPDWIKTEGEIEFNWDMEPLNLFPGDWAEYYFEVADNDRISGPKISRSRRYIARLPSLDELIAQTEAESEGRIVDTEELIKSGREAIQRLRNVARKLDAERETSRQADWQEKKELQSIAEKNAEMTDRIEEVAEQMQSSLEQMQNSSLLSRQILERLAEIQKLFEEVATEEMREARQKLMEALQKMDRQQIQDALKDFELSQEELLQRLERTLALLKRLQLEQKMEAMIRQTEQLVEQQKNLNDDAAAAEEKALPGMSESEDEIRQGLDELKKDAGEFRQWMAEAGMAESPEAQKFAQAVETTDADQNMDRMSQSLREQQRAEAVEQGKEAHGKLTEMLGQMQQQQLAMQGGSAEEIQKAMRKAIDDANYLSQRQEELIREAAALDQRSLRLQEMARAQQDLSAACNGLKNTIADLGKETPFIAAELQSLVNNAVQSMDLATQQCENRDGPAAWNSQRDAMVNLNRAAIRLMESLDQQSQCNSGKGCNNQGIAKLESLCNKQNQLNQQTQNQCNNPTPGSGREAQEQRAALQRLAAEQGSIRKSLEQLATEFGDSRQVLGRLSDIAREMSDVEEGLVSGEVGDQVTQRQLKVLSRMLEASRSLQRRDFSEQRKATTAGEQPVYLPPALSTDLLNDRVQLEDRLRQFLGSGYPPQYEEQIKAYFRALLKAQTQLNAQPQSGEARQR